MKQSKSLSLVCSVCRCKIEQPYGRGTGVTRVGAKGACLQKLDQHITDEHQMTFLEEKGARP